MPRTLKGTGLAGGKRFPLNLRTTQEIRDKIEAAARASGRSLAQEIEARITQSIGQDDAYGGAEVRQLVLAVGATFALAGQRAAPGKSDWIRDAGAYTSAIAAALRELLRGLDGLEKALAVEVLIGELLSVRERLRAEPQIPAATAPAAAEGAPLPPEIVQALAELKLAVEDELRQAVQEMRSLARSVRAAAKRKVA